MVPGSSHICRPPAVTSALRSGVVDQREQAADALGAREHTVNLLVVRHGPAGDAEAWKSEGRDDRLRPLTPDGKKDMREAAFGMATLQPHVDMVAASPLLRAAQTAEILASEYKCKVVTVDALAPDEDPGRTVEWIEQHPTAGTLALVGHEPLLSRLVSYLLVGQPKSFLELKAGGACLMEAASPSPGSFTLKWLLTRRELVRLGE
jgi:phosphohistidine phosphatase